MTCQRKQNDKTFLSIRVQVATRRDQGAGRWSTIANRRPCPDGWTQLAHRISDMEIPKSAARRRPDRLGDEGCRDQVVGIQLQGTVARSHDGGDFVKGLHFMAGYFGVLHSGPEIGDTPPQGWGRSNFTFRHSLVSPPPTRA